MAVPDLGHAGRVAVPDLGHAGRVSAKSRDKRERSKARVLAHWACFLFPPTFLFSFFFRSRVTSPDRPRFRYPTQTPMGARCSIRHPCGP